MPKKRTIRPLISKKSRRNIYDYSDPETKKQFKVYGFELELWDPDSQTRIRRVIKADYQAAKIAYDHLQELIEDANESVPTLLKRNEVRTLGDLYAKYEKASRSESAQEKRRRRSPLTIRRKGFAVATFRKTLGADPELKAIKPALIERFIQKREEGGFQHGGINADLRSLRALFSWGVRRDYVPSNPFKKIDFFPDKIGEPNPLSPEQLARLFEMNPPGSRWYALLMFYLLTGARLSEPLKPKLKWSDIDLESGILTLPFRKGRKASTFPIDDVLLQIMKELEQSPYRKDIRHRQPDDRDYPFPFTPNFVSHLIKKLMKAAGIEATAHDLRDSFVSHLIYLGYPIEEVSKIAGHTTTAITEKYYQGQIQAKRRQMLADLGQHIVAASRGEGSQIPEKTKTQTK